MPSKPVKPTKAMYTAKAIAYYARRYSLTNGRRRWSAETIQHEAAIAYAMVEAGIKSISAGRQNITTGGWLLGGWVAHRRAAARIRS